MLKAEDTRIHVVMNSCDGVKEMWLDYSKNLYVIKYSHCRYKDEEAIERAQQRVSWGENCYHCLNNNSHHFVTWAKTGRENSLADIIESLTYKKGNQWKSMKRCRLVCVGYRRGFPGVSRNPLRYQKCTSINECTHHTYIISTT